MQLAFAGSLLQAPGAGIRQLSPPLLLMRPAVPCCAPGPPAVWRLHQAQRCRPCPGGLRHRGCGVVSALRATTASQLLRPRPCPAAGTCGHRRCCGAARLLDARSCPTQPRCCSHSPAGSTRPSEACPLDQPLDLDRELSEHTAGNAAKRAPCWVGAASPRNPDATAPLPQRHTKIKTTCCAQQLHPFHPPTPGQPARPTYRFHAPRHTRLMNIFAPARILNLLAELHASRAAPTIHTYLLKYSM